MHLPLGPLLATHPTLPGSLTEASRKHQSPVGLHLQSRTMTITVTCFVSAHSAPEGYQLSPKMCFLMDVPFNIMWCVKASLQTNRSLIPHVCSESIDVTYQKHATRHMCSRITKAQQFYGIRNGQELLCPDFLARCPLVVLCLAPRAFVNYCQELGGAKASIGALSRATLMEIINVM